jgi:hypothetical protein
MHGAIMKRAKMVMIILGIALVLIMIRRAVKQSARKEGFATPLVSTPQCPIGYKFFNDKLGDSFCCNGDVDPYKHVCMATGAGSLCAFKVDANSARKLEQCSTLIRGQHAATQAAICPQSLPHYATVGRCCKAGTDVESKNCTTADNSDLKHYCVTTGALKAGEQRCDVLQTFENSSCPSGLQKMSRTLGSDEVNAYGKAAQDMKMPMCFGVDSFCYPDLAIQSAQAKGVFTNKNPANWKYGCSAWETVNIKRDTTLAVDSSYP